MFLILLQVEMTNINQGCYDQASSYTRFTGCLLPPQQLASSSDYHPQVTDEERVAPQVNALHEVTQLYEVALGLESGVRSSPVPQLL